MKNYKLLSHIICQDTPSYGNRDKVYIRVNSSIKAGDTANSSSWIFSNNHIGTHIDVPYHFTNNGIKTYDIPVSDYFFEKVSLIDIPCSSAVLLTIADFEAIKAFIHPETELLLIRTGFEQYRQTDRYWNNNPGLAPELAGYLRNNYQQLRCVGFDFISITSWQHRLEGRAAHRAFLCPENGEKEILVIEDMSLKEIKSNILKVIVAPFLVEDGNGGAVTVIAECEI